MTWRGASVRGGLCDTIVTVVLAYYGKCDSVPLCFTAGVLLVMAGVWPVPGSKSGTTLYRDELGYLYRKKRDTGTSRYLYCKNNCGAHGIDYMGHWTLTQNHDSRCQPVPTTITLNQMKEAIRVEARKTGRAAASFVAVQDRDQ